MARKDDILGLSAETIIGPNVKVKGDLNGDGDLIIDGIFKGDIKTTGSVSINVNAVVKADVQAANVLIAGQLQGNVRAEGETYIKETGRLKGNVHTNTFAIASGGIFIGSSTMHQVEAPDETDSKKSG